MEAKKQSSKRGLFIFLGVIVAIIVFFVARAIYVNSVYDHAFDKATKEYDKAYDKAKKDVDKMMRDYRY